MSNKIWLGLGGAAWSITDQACKRAFDWGFRDIHCVFPDLGPHQWELANIKRYGMTASADLEIPLWVNIGMNVGADISWASPAIQAIRQAGWDYASEEGGGKGQINTIRNVLPFLNYGSENGANMYAGMYSHEATAHFANLMETYYKWAQPTYQATAVDYWSKSKNFGLTLMMYPADLETDLTALLKHVDSLESKGIIISEVLMWCGDDMQKVFSSPWLDIIIALKDHYGLRTDTPWNSTPPTPPTPPKPSGEITSIYYQYQYAPYYQFIKLQGQATDKNGKPAHGKSVGLWYKTPSHDWDFKTSTTVMDSGYFEFVLSSILPQNTYNLRLQTNAAPWVFPELTPLDVYGR